jgi:beta-glucosidase
VFSYEGSLHVPASGHYRLCMETANGYGTVQVGDGEEAVAGRTTAGVYAELAAGRHPLRLTGRADSAADLRLKLTWVTPEVAQADLVEAVKAAGAARTAVVFVFDDNTEGADRAALSLQATRRHSFRPWLKRTRTPLSS